MPPGSTTSSKAAQQPAKGKGSTPSTGRQVRLEPGDVMEARVAQLWFWEGFYARRGINLQHHYDPEPLQVTDLDLLAFDFDPGMIRRKYIGEVKTGTGRSAAKPLDRSIWLRGLRELVGAERAELTTGVKPTMRARQLASGLQVVAQSVEDVERREKVADVAAVADLGAHGPSAFVTLKEIHKHCSIDPELERSYWYLRSEVWFLDPWSAVKRTLGLLGTLATRWTPQIDDDDAKALRWLFAEAISVWTLNLIALVGEAHHLDERNFVAQAHERLAEGVVPARFQRRLSDAIDKYIAGLLATAHAPPSVQVNAMGAFTPKPPEWTDSLIELVGRLAATIQEVRQLPRQLDLLMFERLVNRRHISDVAVERLKLHTDGFGQQRRLLAAFLRFHAALPAAVDKVLAAEVVYPNKEAAPTAEQMTLTDAIVEQQPGDEQKGDSSTQR